MAKKADPISLEACGDLALRMCDGFNEAVGDTKGEITPEVRLTVGILGAVSALRSDTSAGWIVKNLSRTLVFKGVKDE